MEHKPDDFFRKKIESIADKIPENSRFDEELFWGELQKKLKSPKAINWWKWIAVAACMGGLALWGASISRTIPEASKTVYIQSIEPTKEKSIPITEVVPLQKPKAKKLKLKKKEEIQPIKELALKIEPLVVKINPVPAQTLALKKDSIYFKSATMAGTKPRFKTIHVNEISNTEKSPIPQAKFKVRFAARNQQ